MRRTRWVALIYWGLLIVATHWPNLDLGESVDRLGMFQIDKLLHVLAFAGLTFLLFRARVVGVRASLFPNALAAVCVAVPYALMDEYTQQWTGRAVSVSDVIAGLIGIVGMFLVIAAPPPRDRTPRLTVVVRVITAAVDLVYLVVVLAPEGNSWVNRLIQPFFQPWPGIDKLGHFYVAVGLTLLLAASSPAGVRRPRLGVFLTILVIGLSGPIIETAQSFTGRGAELADLYAHQVGLLAAMLGLSVLAVGRAFWTHRRGRSPKDD